MSQNALKKDASPIDLAELSADEQKNVFISFLRNTEAGKEALKSTVNEIERKVKVNIKQIFLKASSHCYKYNFLSKENLQLNTTPQEQ